MRLQVKTHHAHLSDATRAYAEKRLTKLDKRLHDLTLVEVTLSQEHNPSISQDHSAEAVVYTKGPTIVAHEFAETYEAAIDKLVDKLERQIERYRDKRTHEPRRAAARHKEAAQPDTEPEVEEAELEDVGVEEPHPAANENEEAA
jgi:putative sigma-54 modulation protein